MSVIQNYTHTVFFLYLHKIINLTTISHGCDINADTILVLGILGKDSTNLV